MAEPLRADIDWTSARETEDFKHFVFERMKVEVRPNKFVPYKPHRGQMPIHFPVEGEEWMVMVVPAGQRGGKSIAGAAELVARLGMPGQRMWIVAPNYDLTLRVFEMVYEFVVRQQVHGQGSVARHSIAKADNRFIEMKGGSFVRCKSAENPNSLVGDRLTFVLVDEAAQLAEDIWTSYIEPRLVNLNGQALLISSPRGLNWFQKYYLRGKNEETRKLGWRCSKFKTSDNPHIPKTKLAAIKAITPSQVWAQEYEASFVSNAGLIYDMYRDEIYPRGHLFDPDKIKVQPDWTHRYAVDVGVIHPTAAINEATAPNGDVYIYRDYLADKRNHEQHAAEILNMFTYPMLQGWISKDAGRKGPDSASEVTALSIYRTAGLYPRACIDDVEAGISVVQSYLMATLAAPKSTTHPKLFISRDCLETRKGFLTYTRQGRVGHQREEVRSDLPNRPRKYQDDIMDAVRYGLVKRPSYIPTARNEQGQDLLLTEEFIRSAGGAVYQSPGVDF